MSIAYWSSVYNKRPDIKELALFLIMIHSIPPTTVDVERIFKISKITIALSYHLAIASSCCVGQRRRKRTDKYPYS